MSALNDWACAQPSMEAVRDFLDWCEAQKIELAQWQVDRKWPVPITEGREAMLARWQGIDTRKLENERRALLASATSKGTTP